MSQEELAAKAEVAERRKSSLSVGPSKLSTPGGS